MIEGTRTYQRKKLAENPENENASSPAEPRVSTTSIPETDAVNNEAVPSKKLDRRAWFSALVPALGGGLVQILRASNNLQRDLHELSDAPPSIPNKDS